MNTGRDKIIDVVERYINGLGNRDFSGVSFAADVTYKSALSPKVTGQEAIDFLEGVFPIIKGVTIKDHIVEGDYCASRFDFHTIYGDIPVFDRFQVEDGQLKSINPYYDPAPIVEGQKAE